MIEYQIINPRAEHIRAIVAEMRPDDRREVEGLGVNCRRALLAVYRHSFYRRAAIVEGKTAAIWGCDGTLLSSIGHPWLLTTPTIEKVPLAFFRETRREIALMLETRTTLVSDIAEGYDRALRFFRLLGFTISVPHALGPDGQRYHQISLERSTWV